MSQTDDLLHTPPDADSDDGLRQLIAAQYPFDQWLDVLQVADRACRSQEAVRVWCRNGLGRKIAGKYWVGEQELDRLCPYALAERDSLLRQRRCLSEALASHTGQSPMRLAQSPLSTP
jgi:hypothetical protein